MRNFMKPTAFILGMAIATLANAADPLDGLEMDVVAPTEAPAQAVSRIALPSQASVQAQQNAAFGISKANAARGQELGRDFGQATAEQARAQRGNGAPAAGGKPINVGRPETPGRPTTTPGAPVSVAPTITAAPAVTLPELPASAAGRADGGNVPVRK